MKRNSGPYAAVPRAAALPVDETPIVADAAFPVWNYSGTPVAEMVAELRGIANRITCPEVDDERRRLIEILYCVDRAGEAGEPTLRDSLRENAAEAIALAVKIRRATAAYRVLEGAQLAAVTKSVMGRSPSHGQDLARTAPSAPTCDFSALEPGEPTQGEMAL